MADGAFSLPPEFCQPMYRTVCMPPHFVRIEAPYKPEELSEQFADIVFFYECAESQLRYELVPADIVFFLNQRDVP